MGHVPGVLPTILFFLYDDVTSRTYLLAFAISFSFSFPCQLDSVLLHFASRRIFNSLLCFCYTYIFYEMSSIFLSLHRRRWAPPPLVVRCATLPASRAALASLSLMAAANPAIFSPILDAVFRAVDSLEDLQEYLHVDFSSNSVQIFPRAFRCSQLHTALPGSPILPEVDSEADSSDTKAVAPPAAVAVQLASPVPLAPGLNILSVMGDLHLDISVQAPLPLFGTGIWTPVRPVLFFRNWLPSSLILP